MKQTLLMMLLFGTISIMLIGCGWAPDIEAVPMTEPWTSMKLPVQKDAIIFRSDPKEFRAVHKDDKVPVLKEYSNALKALGWEALGFEESDYDMTVKMGRSGESLILRVYDFKNTGVVIEME